MPKKITITPECKHTITQGRQNEKGSWCVDCGKKILEVETRQCKDCSRCSVLNSNIGLCREKLMHVTLNMHVTYSIEKGTCFKPII